MTKFSTFLLVLALGLSACGEPSSSNPDPVTPTLGKLVVTYTPKDAKLSLTRADNAAVDLDAALVSERDLAGRASKTYELAAARYIIVLEADGYLPFEAEKVVEAGAEVKVEASLAAPDPSDATDPTSPDDPAGPSDPSDVSDASDPGDASDGSDPADSTDPTDMTDPTDPSDSGDATRLEPLSVASDGYTLLSGDQPFFWMSDTLWLLFAATQEEDALLALDSAKAKGFNVVQTFLTGAFSSGESPGSNAFGDLPFVGNNPANLNPDYFDYVAWVVEEAAKRGLYVAITYGEVGRTGTSIPYPVQSRENAYAYAQAVGSRFREQTLANQIIWVNGQDRNPNRDSGQDVWVAMSEGLADGVNGVNALDDQADYSTVFMSYHPDGGASAHGWSSSDFFQTASWLDFNAINVWKYYADLVGLVTEDRGLAAPKPTVCYEPSYEGHDYADIEPITAWQVRFQGYWCALSGAAGYSYGHTDGYNLINAENWPGVLDSEGRSDMVHLRDALSAQPLLGRVPDQALIVSDAGAPDYGKTYVAAARGNGYAFVYSTDGRSFSLDLTRQSGSSFEARWFNPRDGGYTPAVTVATGAAVSFDPPGDPGDANDWLLVLDAQP